MTIALRGSATTGTTTVTAPTGTTAGDLLVVYVIAPTGTSIGLPAGWTSQRTANNASGGGESVLIAYLIYSSGTTWTTSSATSNVCVAYSGCSSTTPILADAAPATGTTSGTISTPSVTNTAAGAWRVDAFFGKGFGTGTTTWSSPSDTSRSNIAAAYGMLAADSNGSVATGSSTATASVSFPGGSNSWVSWAGILQPSPAAAISAPNISVPVNRATLF